MQILTDKFLQQYKNNTDFSEYINNFKKSSKGTNFDYLNKSSSVFSSNIEWNSLDLNSFMNHKMNKSTSKDVEEIENLISAYSFAQENELNEKTFLNTHTVSSKILLIKSRRWVYRNDKVWIFWSWWLVYLAIEPEFVEREMRKLFDDILRIIRKKINKWGNILL